MIEADFDRRCSSSTSLPWIWPPAPGPLLVVSQLLTVAVFAVLATVDSDLPGPAGRLPVPLLTGLLPTSWSKNLEADQEHYPMRTPDFSTMSAAHRLSSGITDRAMHRLSKFLASRKVFFLLETTAFTAINVS
ncbi:hypothetical protein GKIL_0210 [Gloeobacter kilaueensis JS1]|uniref:Uncharacterized protein n=1 Tax=Gloeobacter kilaueensis (strain ATCC BAA-2537 / CCAP 1431/1 / ULC 316 / JS1) TaxID=1183438 RepID=U5QC27_GLOK1|nr:hypothetical protein GKIL_0210 [Gloeobacter kilaueensis JS1]